MINGFEDMKVLSACIRCQYYDDKICHNDKGTCIWKEIENVVKALDIVFNKIVDLYFIENGCSFEEYNKEHRTGYPLEKEEFELLRKTYLCYLSNSIQNSVVNDDNANLSSLPTTNEYKNKK